MLEQMSSREVTEWLAYDRLYGLPDWRDDFRVAAMCALLANINRDAKKKPSAYSPADFMPDFGVEKEPQSEERQMAIMKQVEMIAQAQGAQGAW